MEVIALDVCGKLAHFRKYYANNTAFSYAIPPRTTIVGILAAIMGYPRDAYYEQMGMAHLRIGIQILKPIKKNFHRINFLSIKSKGDALDGTGDFTGAGGHIQTPFEVVSGYHLGKDRVEYRIYIAPGQQDNGEFDRIKHQLSQKSQHFNISLGVANFTAWIEQFRVLTQVSPMESNEVVKIHSACPSAYIDRLHFDKEGPDTSYNYIEEEMIPADFKGNNNRELSRLVRIVFSTTGLPFSAVVNTPFYRVLTPQEEVHHIFFIE